MNTKSCFLTLNDGEKNDNDKEEFRSQIGQDNYYTMYAYFLKQRNGVKEFFQRPYANRFYVRASRCFQ